MTLRRWRPRRWRTADPDRTGQKPARANNVKEAESGKCRWDAQEQLFKCVLGTATFADAGSEEFQAAMEADNAKWLQAYNTQDAKTLGTMYGEGAINSVLFATVAEEPWRTDADHRRNGEHVEASEKIDLLLAVERAAIGKFPTEACVRQSAFCILQVVLLIGREITRHVEPRAVDTRHLPESHVRLAEREQAFLGRDSRKSIQR